MAAQTLGSIDARPVKSFFVHMLTRDIDLQDAILDLLDNCVDGVQRSASASELRRKQPYRNYWARIELSGDEFRIEDNCGGIPWSLHNYAFRLGRLEQEADSGRQTIGTYGIGMKRAIFKLGDDGVVETHASDASYKVHFSADWMRDESKWDIVAERVPGASKRGTLIVIRALRDAVRKELASEAFMHTFRNTLATYYAYIIGKGFQVYLNGEQVQPRQLRLLYAEAGDEAFKSHPIRPFIYRTEWSGVSVFLAVGFTRGIPSKEEADEGLENYRERYSSADAGWTVVCNDRTVLYCDKTPVTGWGVSGVPQYHMQFIAISGVVVFSSENPRLLPTTTTKRGIDAQSELYLHVKDKMVEGMKLFTDYTNVWKGKELVETSRKEFEKTRTLGLEDLLQKQDVTMRKTHGVLTGRQYRPALPRPKSERVDVQISFRKPAAQVRTVSKYVFGSSDGKPGDVGEKCFDVILEEAEG